MVLEPRDVRELVGATRKRTRVPPRVLEITRPFTSCDVLDIQISHNESLVRIQNGGQKVNHVYKLSIIEYLMAGVLSWSFNHCAR